MNPDMLPTLEILIPGAMWVAFYNVLAYADDLVLLAPSRTALQQLLNVFSVHIDEIDMTCNVNKTVCNLYGVSSQE